MQCTDGQLNGDETDIDCGGGCPACSVGGVCALGVDCETESCVMGVCVTRPPTHAPTNAPTSAPTPTPCEKLELPDMPVLSSARFSSTGGALYLEWNTDTDRGGHGGAT